MTPDDGVSGDAERGAEQLPSEPGSQHTLEHARDVVSLGATMVVALAATGGLRAAGAAMAAAIRPAEATVAAMRVDLRMSGSS